MSGKRTDYAKLTTACFKGQYKAVERYLKTNNCDFLEMPLINALYNKHFEIVKLLIQHNAPINEAVLNYVRRNEDIFGYVTNELRKRKLKAIDETK